MNWEKFDFFDFRVIRCVLQEKSLYLLLSQVIIEI